jgi:hypothetical protein
VYLLDVLGNRAIAETENLTPPTKVQVRRQSPASALQSALKNPPPSALRQPAAKSAKTKGVNFTPAKRFELRTYIPSPTSGNTSTEEDDDEQVGGSVEQSEEEEDEQEEEEREEEGESEEDIEGEDNERGDEGDEGKNLAQVSTTKLSSMRKITYSRPSIMTAFHHNIQFWMTPVSVLDTAAACLATAASFLVAHLFIIAALEATITPASLKSMKIEAEL